MKKTTLLRLPHLPIPNFIKHKIEMKYWSKMAGLEPTRKERKAMKEWMERSLVSEEKPKDLVEKIAEKLPTTNLIESIGLPTTQTFHQELILSKRLTKKKVPEIEMNKWLQCVKIKE